MKLDVRAMVLGFLVGLLVMAMVPAQAGSSTRKILRVLTIHQREILNLQSDVRSVKDRLGDAEYYLYKPIGCYNGDYVVWNWNGLGC